MQFKGLYFFLFQQKPWFEDVVLQQATHANLIQGLSKYLVCII